MSDIPGLLGRFELKVENQSNPCSNSLKRSGKWNSAKQKVGVKKKSKPT